MAEIKKAQYAFDAELFKTRLNDSIKEKGYKNAELASLCGVSAAAVGHYRKGTRSPRGANEIVPIAKALNVSLDYLYGLSDVKTPNSPRMRMNNYKDAYQAITALLSCFPIASITVNHHYDESEEEIRDRVFRETRGQVTVSFEESPKNTHEMIISIHDDQLVGFQEKKEQIKALAETLSKDKTLPKDPLQYHIDGLNTDLNDEMRNTPLPLQKVGDLLLRCSDGNDNGTEE